jgi:hypothetical protein
MALAEFDGTLTTTSSEQSLFDITTGGPKYFTSILYLHNMTATETLRVRVYVYDTNGAAYRTLVDETITGAQDPPAYYMPTVLSSQYKVTVLMSAGTNRAITWKRFEHT